MRRLKNGPLLIKFTYIDRNNGMWISGDNIVTAKVLFLLKNIIILK